MGIYGALTRWVGDKPWFRPVAMNLLPAVDKRLLHHGWRANPFPTLLLTTIGARSGNPHEVPLWYTEDEAGLTVVASNYGREDPDWSRNLMAHPMCTVTVGKQTFSAQARLAGSADAERRFEDFTAFYPSYRDYAARAARQISVWVLERPPGTD